MGGNDRWWSSPWAPVVAFAATPAVSLLQRLRRNSQERNQRLLDVVVQEMVLNLVSPTLQAAQQSRLRKAIHEQRDLLLQIIKDAKDTEFGDLCSFRSIRSVSEFRSFVPIQTANDLSKANSLKSRTDIQLFARYIERIAAGADSVLTSSSCVRLAITAGTSGCQKVVPVTQEMDRFFLRECVVPVVQTVIDAFPSLRSPGKICRLLFSSDRNRTSSGMEIGPAMAAPDDFPESILRNFTTPIEAFGARSAEDILVLHCFFALGYARLCLIEASSLPLLLSMMRCIEVHSEVFIQCLHDGKVPSSPLARMPDGVREALNRSLKTDTSRADAVSRAIRLNAGFRGIAKCFWPDLQVCVAASTGVFETYKEAYRYYFGDIPLYSLAYTAAEGVIGYNDAVDKDTYILHPRSMFFEFRPVEAIDGKDIVTMDGVLEDRDYELLVTNRSGLFRYSLDDVVRIVGREGATPRVRIVRKIGDRVTLCRRKRHSNGAITLTSEGLLAAFKSALKSAFVGGNVQDFLVFTGPCKQLPGGEKERDIGRRTFPGTENLSDSVSSENTSLEYSESDDGDSDRSVTIFLEIGCRNAPIDLIPHGGNEGLFRLRELEWKIKLRLVEQIALDGQLSSEERNRIFAAVELCLVQEWSFLSLHSLLGREKGVPMQIKTPRVTDDEQLFAFLLSQREKLVLDDGSLWNQHRLASGETESLPSLSEFARERLSNWTHYGRVMLFMKGHRKAPRCGFSKRMVAILERQKVEYTTFDILENEAIRQGLKEYCNWKTYPQLYVDGEFVGGLDVVEELESSGELQDLLGTAA